MKLASVCPRMPAKVLGSTPPSVAWVYSGGGSGGARTNGASDMKKALTNAGLSINTTLWDFYKSGAGKDYVRTDRFTMNEVPWSKYTDSVKNSFASYGDAAIIVLSRKAGLQKL